MPVRKVQRNRTGSRGRLVAKRNWEESEEESSSSSDEEQQQQATKKPKAKPKVQAIPAKTKNKQQNDDYDNDNDENSFDSYQYEFSSGEESKRDANDDEDFSAGNAESSSADDDDESDFEQPKRRGRNTSTRRSNQKSSRQRASRRKKDSSSEEEFHQDESEEESVVVHSEVESSSDDQQVRRPASARRKEAPKAKGRAAAKKRKTPPRQKKTARPQKDDDDNEDSEHWEEGEDSSRSEEEDAKGRAGTRRRATTTNSRENGGKRKATTSPAASRARRKKPDEGEESSVAESEESEFGDQKAASRSNKRRKAQTRAAPKGLLRSKKESSESEAESSYEEDTNPTTPARRRTVPVPSSSGSRSRRASAQKAMSSLVVLDDDKEEDDEYLIPKSFRKKKNDDGDFELEQDGEEQESDEDLGSAEDDEDQLVKGQNESGDEKVGIVDDDDIGSAEESEDEAAATTPYKAARLNVEHQSPARITKPSALDDYDEDESSDDDDKKQAAFSPSVPKCNSEKDAITDEDLPQKHVCYFAPDGKTKQCFALETLHKIAICSMRGQIRQTLTGRVVQTFLQPPHFRSAMSDDLLDQIASRFGRDALDLHSDFYKRQEEAGDASDNGESDHDEPSLEASRAFVQQVQEYVRAQMGSHDLYVCPVCYLVAKRKCGVIRELDYEKEAEKDDDTLFAHYAEKQSDPMQVLGDLDESFSDSFVMASSFCFPTAAKVKYHLREDHHVQTKNVEGNELYASFRIRTTDGLLQRFLKKKRGHVNQGAMQSYWFSGYNFDFVYLYSLVEQAAICRSIAARGGQGDESSQDEERQEAEVFLDKARKFFDSFADLGQRLWAIVSGPYERASGKDLKDFVVDENVDEPGAESDGNVHRMLDRELSQNSDGLTQEDRDLLDRYAREEGDEVVDDEEEEEADDLQDSDSEEENGELQNVHASSSEEDEWERDIKRKRKARSPARMKSRQRVSRTSSRAAAEEPKLPGEPQETSRSVSGGSRKRVVIHESDEE